MTVRWDDITGKPTAFPPLPHAHHPDDLVGTRNSDYEARGTNAGFHCGLAHIIANEVEIIAPDGGVATQFFVFPIGQMTKLLILGNYNNIDVFQDEVTVEGFVPPFTLPVIVQNNLVGAPGARTYGIVTNAVNVVIAGGGAAAPVPAPLRRNPSLT